MSRPAELDGRKVVVVMPAYNAAKTLERTLADVPKEWVHEIILVDDASKDGTADLARKLGLKVVVHERNRGYGANQKTCYREALAAGADAVVMVHPDHQYDPRVLPQLVAGIDALHAAGRRDEALEELRKAVTIFAEVGRPGGMEPEIWKLVDW